MSICNVWLERDHALLAVDTAGQSIDTAGQLFEGAWSEWSKLSLLSHANIAFGFRGVQPLFFNILAQVHMAPGGDSFDALELDMRDRLAWAVDRVRAVAPPNIIAGLTGETRHGRLVERAQPYGCHRLLPIRSRLDV